MPKHEIKGPMLKRFFVVFAAALACVSAFGQTVRSRTLKIEDVLRIQVFGRPEVTGDVQIDPEGNISAPFAGTIHADGRTVEDVAADLTRRYKQTLFLRDPIVSVIVVTLRPIRATIGGGGIARPDTYIMRAGDTILNLLNRGGGANRDVADLRRSYLRRSGSSEAIPIDLYSMTVFGDVTQNYEIQDGDELIVPEARNNQINVLGAVARPSQVPYREPMRAWDAITIAGGEIRYRSRFSRTTILRQREGVPSEYVRIPVDLTRFIRKGDSSQNIALQPGDIIFVPETNTPDFAQIAQISQSAFLLDTFGRIFGFRLFR